MKYIRTLLIISIFISITLCSTKVALGEPPGAFSKTSPINGATDQPRTITLSWESSNNAWEYWACINVEPSCPLEGEIRVGMNTSITITDLVPNTTYYWQVVAWNHDGPIYYSTDANNGTWWSFTTEAETAGILEVTPTNNLISSGNQGGSFTPSSKAYTLKNIGTASINWTASKTQTWVSLSSTGGTLSPNGSTTVTVSINNSANSLSPGTYNDTITFTNTTNGNGNTNRTVNLTVNAVDANSVCPETVSVTASSYYDIRVPQNAYDCNLSTPWNSGTYTGSITAQFTAPITFDCVVLTASAAPATDEDYTIYGSNDGSTWTPIAQATRRVELSPHPDFITLEPITFPQVNYQYLRIDVDGGASWVQLNEVQLCTVGGLAVTPSDGLVSSGNEGGPFSPSSKIYTLSNTGDTSVNWTASKTQTWVSLSSTGGTLSPDETKTLTVSINNSANSLSQGTYNDTVTFTNTTNGNGNTTRTVNLTVNEITSPLTIITTSLSSGTVGIVYSESLSATGGTTPYSWSITSGNLPSGLSLNTSGGISGTPSVSGTYNFIVQVQDSSTPQQTATKNLSIVTNSSSSAALQVSPADNFVSSGVQGGPFSPLSKTYTITNTGGTSLNWTASKTQSWLDISGTSGTLTPGASTTVILSPSSNANSLAPGTYHDTVTFTNTTNGNGNTTRSATLYVTTTDQCATFDFLTNTLHVPCFNFDNASYWLDLGIVNYNPITLTIKDYGDNSALGNESECASFDFFTGTFHIPCFHLECTTYWLDLGLVSYEPILLELKDYEAVGSCGYSKYSGTWNLKRTTCIDSNYDLYNFDCPVGVAYYTVNINTTTGGNATISVPSQVVPNHTVIFTGNFTGNTLNLSSSNVSGLCNDGYCTTGTGTWNINFTDINHGHGTWTLYSCGNCSHLWNEDTIELYR